MQQFQPLQGSALSASHSTVAPEGRLLTRFWSFDARMRKRNFCGARACTQLTDAAHHHAVLGVGPGASKTEIKRAYRRLALKYHPDVCTSNDGHFHFLHIKAAYDSIMTSTMSLGTSTRMNSSSPCSTSWRGEAGPDDSFYAPFNAAEEAPSYDPWWEVLEQCLTMDQSNHKPTHSSAGDSCRAGKAAQRSNSVTWEDW